MQSLYQGNLVGPVLQGGAHWQGFAVFPDNTNKTFEKPKFYTK